MPKAQPLSLAELLSLLPRVQATLQFMVGRAAAAKAAPRAAAKAARPGRRRRRGGGNPALQQKLLDLLKASKGGLSLGDVVKKAGGPRGAIKYHLRALRARKKVRVKGDRKLARWMVA
jgi:hypothetical protein